MIKIAKNRRSLVGYTVVTWPQAVPLRKAELQVYF